MRSSMRCASCGANRPSRVRTTIRNSSPPQRTIRSSSRTASRSRRAISTRTASPAAWPNASLMRLKWSMSIRKTLAARPPSPDRLFTAAWKWRRLARPVSGSVSLWRFSEALLWARASLARRTRRNAWYSRPSETTMQPPSADHSVSARLCWWTCSAFSALSRFSSSMSRARCSASWRSWASSSSLRVSSRSSRSRARRCSRKAATAPGRSPARSRNLPRSSQPSAA
mmetsp:Transcript_1044/g.2742  ORF Transcript_1044/g.2742 Transcript_1044/m.2742 type:complete len:227 (-) Transcript_1044:240-920(-)